MTARLRSFADLFSANGHAAEQRHLVQQFVTNLTLLRRDIGRQLSDPRRSLEVEAGVPSLAEAVNLELYHQLFARDAIANRVVCIFADEAWQQPFKLYERESGKIVTPFEQAWDGLSQSLQPTQSWHKEEEGSAVYSHMENADRLMGIGYMGGILLGTDDGLPLDQPAAGVVETGSMQPATNYKLTTNAGPKATRRLLYMREFAQGWGSFPSAGSTITAQKYETNFASPRYGLPTLYQITTGNPQASADGAAMPSTTQSVHWTRIIHMAEQDGFHTPRLQPVLNNVLGHKKIDLADPEAFWRGAFIKYFLQSPPALGGMVDVDNDSLKDAFEEMDNGVQRFMTLLGLDAKAIPPQVVDPRPHTEAQLEAICIQLGIPVRVFKGSERGELASSQDAKSWNQRMRKRKTSIITPRVICPVVDRLILLGCLPQPERYFVAWPKDEALSEAEKAVVLETRTKAYALFQSSGLSSTVAPLDYMTRFDDLTDEEAKEIEKAAKKHTDEQDAKDAEQQRQKIDAGLVPDPAAPKVVAPVGGRPPIPQPSLNAQADDDGGFIARIDALIREPIR